MKTGSVTEDVPIKVRRSLAKRARFAAALLIQTLRIWVTHLPGLLLITATFFLPLWIAKLIAFRSGVDPETVESIASTAYTVPATLITAALTHRVLGVMQGQRVSLGESLRAGLAKPWPVLGASLFSGVLIYVGLFVLIIPGLVLLCVFYVVIPVAVKERPGIMAALDRSQKLVHGYRVELFIAITLMVLAFMGSIPLCQSLVLPNPGELAHPANRESLAMYACWTMGQEALLYSFSAVMGNVAYGLLRAEERHALPPPQG